MKKSVIVLIGIIYIAAIVFVGFFGMKLTAYDEMIYITDIECVNEELKVSNDPETNEEQKSIWFKFKQGGNELENTITIKYKVYPENASLKGTDAAKLVYDENTKVAKVNGLHITFLKKGVLTVQIISKDGSNVIETITLISY